MPPFPRDLEQVAETLMNRAIEGLLEQETLNPLHFILSPAGLATIPLTDPTITERMMTSIICQIAHDMDATAIFFVSEAWMVRSKDYDEKKPVEEHEQREEAIIVTIATRSDEWSLLAHFRRDNGVIDVAKPCWDQSAPPRFAEFWRTNEAKGNHRTFN